MGSRSGITLEIPVLLTAAVLLLMSGLQAFGLWHEQTSLNALFAAQTPTMQQMGKVRIQVDALASKTAKLAEGGDAGAKTIVDDLKRRGVNIKPSP